MKRRTLLNMTAAMTVAGSMIAGAAFAADPIIIGAVAPKTGPLAGGSTVSHWPNIELWVSDVNGRGGLNVGGEMRLIEGGAKLFIDGQRYQDTESSPLGGEYTGLYKNMTHLIASGASDVDLRPMALVLDSFTLGSRENTEPFFD